MEADEWGSRDCNEIYFLIRFGKERKFRFDFLNFLLEVEMATWSNLCSSSSAAWKSHRVIRRSHSEDLIDRCGNKVLNQSIAMSNKVFHIGLKLSLNVLRESETNKHKRSWKHFSVLRDVKIRFVVAVCARKGKCNKFSHISFVEFKFPFL